MRKVIGATATVAATCGVIVACAFSAPEVVPRVAGTDLQSDIAARLTSAGERLQSVTCRDDLIGEVGQTARCDVVISPTNSFAPLVTVTGVDGATINYEMSPTLSGAQLERAVSRMLAATGAPGESVSCPSGLVGQIGAVALCDVTTAGATVQRTARVHRVAGLRMDFDLIPVLSRAEVEGLLLDELAVDSARRPDSAVCAGDLEGRHGTSVDCAVVAGPVRADFTVIVTAVAASTIEYSYWERG
ncbi:DUF4333 domain-containing protein [Mycolicibacterium hippocampi]|uniref:DUF4333 domain-containing protein n=1 Tax=Mycolicibacterium hippocampi TaxID=659824 RepID=A0A7I9ZRE9_9MYCO|nr:DUF4333 domain-containing protein [Mycolicibacterium hippocampi]GFH03602.1 hypothetical protein MHIP_40850 [Mycolicibacterium hippocampi]